MHVAHRTRARLDLFERENIERKKAEEEKNGGKIPVGDTRKNRECERFLPTCGPRSRRRVSSSVSCNVEEQQGLEENCGGMVGVESGDVVGFGSSNNHGFQRIGTGVFGSERNENVGSMEVGGTDDDDDDDVVFLGEEEEGGIIDVDEVIYLLESGSETESVTVVDNDVVDSFGSQLGEGCGSVSPNKKCCSEGFLSRGSASFVFEGMENCTLRGSTESPVACVKRSDERVISSNAVSVESDTLEMLTDEGNSESSSSDVQDMNQYSEDCYSMEPRQSCIVDRDGEKGEDVEASRLRNGRRENIIEAGLKRRKAYGLDILAREGRPSMNHNTDDLLDLTQKEKSAIGRTRSRFNLKKARKMSKFGTLVQPISIDDGDLELSSVDGDEDDDVMKLSTEHNNSDADETDDRMGAWRRKLNNDDVVDEYNDDDDDVISEKEEIGAKKTKSSTRKCGSYNAKNGKKVGKLSGVHGDKNHILQKKISRRKPDSYDALNNDHSDSHSNGDKISFHETKCIRRSSGPYYAVDTDVRNEIENDYDISSYEGMSKFNGRKACPHEMDNIVFAKRHRKLKQRKRKRKKSTSCLKNYDLFKILDDSIYNEISMSPENLSNGDDGGNTPVMGPSIPLKFTFGTEKSVLVEKSEVEKQLDELWREMEFALGCTEVNYYHAAEDGNDSIHSSGVGVDRATLCNQGNHKLLIDEQIGYICKFCAYVGVEMKHILPPFIQEQ